MTKLNYHQAQFVLSAARVDQLPEDTGAEIAIVGRSNAGKSSVLNCLTQNKNLARVSKTPGRTQLINLFALGAHHRITDLPGYGFAKVPAEVKKQWEILIDEYLRSRASLKGLVVVMDIRHPLKPYDLQLLDWCSQCRLQVHILLNKSDKLGPQAAKQTFMDVKKIISEKYELASVQIFSAMKRTGLEDFEKVLNRWFTYSR